MAKEKKGYKAQIEALAADHERAATAYAELRTAQEAIVTERALTDEETAARTAAKAERDTIADRIAEMRSERAQAKSVAEARRDAGLDMDATGSDAEVIHEPRTYGEGSPNSWFADYVRLSNPGFKGADVARANMSAYAAEVASEVRKGSPEGLRAVRSAFDANRGSNSAADFAVKEMRSRADAGVREQRAMDTGSTSGGSFTTPQYFVSDYAPYRQFGRVFIDAANKQSLPDYGMEVYIPAVSNAAGVGAQASQNTGITETDPTALYLSNALTTNAGQVTVSQQLLDRAGPNFAFDKMVFDQLNRAYCVTVDQYVLTTALATAGTIGATASGFNVSGLAPAAASNTTGTSAPFAAYAQQKIGQAKAATVNAAGTLLPATHAFFTPTRWEYLASESDQNGRPFVQPSYSGVFQAIAAGSSGKPVVEGDTGYTMGGLNVFEDGNIPLQSAVDQTIVAHMPEVWVWEGDLVPRTIPQTYAQDLAVLLQLYAYVTCIVRYPLAVQTIQWQQVVAWPA